MCLKLNFIDFRFCHQLLDLFRSFLFIYTEVLTLFLNTVYLEMFIEHLWGGRLSVGDVVLKIDVTDGCQVE